MPSKSVCLGPEFDPGLRIALRSVLEDLGACGEGEPWAVGSPGEPTEAELTVTGGLVLIESRTYAGLTVTGEEAAVSRIQELVIERQRTPED